ncbi:PhoH family protein [Fodinicurvata sp. EGI_FJ10296]|uniref:PhoH family protein n=1 Tax=Fodinicurvata sp. EGI_FJ10296 TaxID=3231908 RepID=UPI003456F971
MTQAPEARIAVSFNDNRLVPLLYGEHDTHLVRIEHQMGVRLASRGNEITVIGAQGAADSAVTVLKTLWNRLERGLTIGNAEIDTVIRMMESGPGEPETTAALSRFNRTDNLIRTKKRLITPRTVTQAQYIDALSQSDLAFGLGPAGTGKTYLAVAYGVSLLIQGRVERLVLSRPAVEAGERLGFLPGDLKEKVDPYLRPLYDALYDTLPMETVTKHMENAVIEIAPLAFMRGRTLSNAYVILDEAQNTTTMQMRMVLTRLGEGSRMVITGDLSQIDLPHGTRSGLADAVSILDGMDGVSLVRFSDADVVRHELVARIVRAYEKADRNRHEGRAERRLQNPHASIDGLPKDVLPENGVAEDGLRDDRDIPQDGEAGRAAAPVTISDSTNGRS